MTTHWLLRGLDMRTVVIVTAAGTALYFGLVRSDDAMQRDIADIKDDVAEVKKTLVSIELQLRRSDVAAYPWKDVTPSETRRRP